MILLSRTLKDDFEQYQASVKKLSEESKQQVYGSQGAVCEICHKTKFADGVGHKCHYCGLRSCARCGGKLTIKAKLVGNLELSFIFYHVCVCVCVLKALCLRLTYRRLCRNRTIFNTT